MILPSSAFTPLPKGVQPKLKTCPSKGPLVARGESRRTEDCAFVEQRFRLASRRLGLE